MAKLMMCDFQGCIIKGIITLLFWCLGLLPLGKAAVMSCRHSNKPAERPTWRGTNFPTRSEPPMKWVLQYQAILQMTAIHERPWAWTSSPKIDHSEQCLPGLPSAMFLFSPQLPAPPCKQGRLLLCVLVLYFAVHFSFEEKGARCQSNTLQRSHRL